MNSSNQPSPQRHADHAALVEKFAKDGQYTKALEEADRARKALDPQYSAASTARCEYWAAFAHFGLAGKNPLEAEAARHSANWALALATQDRIAAVRMDVSLESDALILQADDHIGEIKTLIEAIGNEDRQNMPAPQIMASASRVVSTPTEESSASFRLSDHPTYVAFVKAKDDITSEQSMTSDEWHRVRIQVSNVLAVHERKHIELPANERLLAKGLLHFCDYQINEGVYQVQRALDLLYGKQRELNKAGDLDFEEVLVDCLLRTQPSMLQRWSLKWSLIRINFKRRKQV